MQMDPQEACVDGERGVGCRCDPQLNVTAALKAGFPRLGGGEFET